MFKYGPFSWGPDGNMNNGVEAVDYDEMGIPVDVNGNQLLDIKCILHPHHKPIKGEYNEYLGIKIPCFETTKEWFTNNFFDIEDKQVQMYIIKWLLKGPNGMINTYCQKKVKECGSMEEFRKSIYGS